MKQVTAVLVGAGQRGVEAYASYALNYPNELKFVAVAEPREDRREDFRKQHNIPLENCFSDWKELLSKPKMADCILICTQDTMHYEPVKEAFEKEYHILCEKPMSPNKEELIEIGYLAEQSDKVLSICHVLRYSPFFTKIKDIIDKGMIGKLATIQHIESIGYWHMAHSFVRGNWRNKELSSPIILQKCCHDMDIITWLVGSRCKSVSSYGNLLHFTKDNAPKDAPKYCMDGCSERDNCPFFAPRFYLEHPKAYTDGFAKVVSLDTSRQGILKELEKGPYGRCVYHCDNDVVDNQVVNLQYENGVTVSFTMCAFSNKCERIINIMGTKGQIRGNMEENTIEVVDFVTGRTTKIELHVPATGHSGSDVSMMKDFVSLVALDGNNECKSSALEAIQSHLIALAAEESRLYKGKVIKL